MRLWHLTATRIKKSEIPLASFEWLLYIESLLFSLCCTSSGTCKSTKSQWNANFMIIFVIDLEKYEFQMFYHRSTIDSIQHVELKMSQWTSAFIVFCFVLFWTLTKPNRNNKFQQFAMKVWRCSEMMSTRGSEFLSQVVDDVVVDLLAKRWRPGWFGLNFYRLMMSRLISSG